MTESTTIAPPTSEPNLAAERKQRKKSKPDTAFEKAPKVIPGGAVVYIGRLPHGFYESELRAYLSQFGDITRLRLSRNPRTGASRHFAFVEFRSADVAKIVVETMHNYLIMGHLLQCQLVPEEKIHSEMWKGANRKFIPIPWCKMEAKRHNASLETKPTEEKAKAAAKKLAKQKAKLAEMGISYDMDIVSGTL